MRQTLRTALVLLAAAAASGCDPAPIYDPGAAPAVGSAGPRPEMRAYGTVENPGYAVDNNINTIAEASKSAERSSLTIDLGKTRMLNLVVIDHGRSEFGFARQVAVLTSLDGRKFTPRHTAAGTRRVTTICLISPVLARYVRLDVVAPGAVPWAAAEVHVQ